MTRKLMHLATLDTDREMECGLTVEQVLARYEDWSAGDAWRALVEHDDTWFYHAYQPCPRCRDAGVPL